MRSYRGIVLSLGLITPTSEAVLFAQEETGTEQAPSPAPVESDAVVPSTQTPAPAPTTPAPSAPKVPVPPGTAPTKPVAPAGTVKPGVKTVPGKTTKPIKKKVRKLKKGATPTQAGVAPTNELDAAIVGEAQVLPAKTFRARYIMRSVNGEKGYDSAGKEQNLGATLSALGHAVVLEYGITDRIVFQMITPYTSSNELVINANEFKQSAVYEKQYAKFVDQIAPTLIQNNICADVASCRTAIDNGLALATTTAVELPSGELATVGSNVPIRDAINSIILKSVEPQSGKTGIGDIQMGLGYNLIKTPMNVLTLGLGVRFPSGLFNNVADAYRAPGSGFLTTGMLLRYDLRLTPVIISLSHQFEYSLNKAKKTRSSLLSPGFLNGQDPTADDPDIPGAGDGVANEMMIERKGIYHAGYLRVAYALGHITSYLKPVAAYAYYGWAVDPEYHNQGHLYRKKEELYTASYALSFDGLAMNPMIPASISYRRELSIGGRNAFMAPDSHYLTLTGYYQF